MELNYPITGLIILIVIILLIIIIRRNQKDEKDFEKSVNESEIDPEQHQKEDI